MKGLCCDVTPILGSSAGYREKRSNCLIDSHWASKHIALKYMRH